MDSHQTVLITGANSGIGYEAARQFASDGWGRVLLGCRNPSKGRAAVKTLEEETTLSVFELVEIDVSSLDSVSKALAELRSNNIQLDGLVMNAGGTPPAGEDGRPQLTSAGIGVPFAVNVLGHTALAAGARSAGLLRPGALVVYAGSETARGVPSMGLGPHSIHELAVTLKTPPAKAIATFARLGHLDKAKSVDEMTEYATHKLIGTLWMSAFARRLDADGKALTISPGSTHGTAAGAGGPLWMRFMAAVLMPYVMPLFGMAHSVADGAGRYLAPFQSPASFDSGAFYASPGNRLTGALALQQSNPELLDEVLQEAAWEALSSLTGGLSASA